MSGVTKYLSIKRSVLFMIAGLVAFVIYLYFFIGIPRILKVLDGINSVNTHFTTVSHLSQCLLQYFFGQPPGTTSLEASQSKSPIEKLTFTIGLATSAI